MLCVNGVYLRDITNTICFQFYTYMAVVRAFVLHVTLGQTEKHGYITREFTRQYFLSKVRPITTATSRDTRQYFLPKARPITTSIF